MRILIVEDHADTRKAFHRLLERRGYAVDSAEGVAEAERLATTAAPDLVLCDMRLVDGDGCDLLVNFRKRWPLLPAVAITGWTAAIDRARCEAAGFDAILIKPVCVERMDAAIKAALLSRVDLTLQGSWTSLPAKFTLENTPCSSVAHCPFNS